MPTVVKRQPRPHSQQSIEELGNYLHQRFDEAISESKRKFLLNHLRAYYFLRYAGLRRGEVHSLRLENINLNKGVIHLRHVKEIGFKVKSGTEQTVPLAKILVDEFFREDLEERGANLYKPHRKQHFTKHNFSIYLLSKHLKSLLTASDCSHL